MSDSNRSLRIRTDVGNSQNVNINLTQDYDTFEILSLKIDGKGIYKLHNSNYGVVAGRVLANDGFGVPNAKVSIFIESEFSDEISNDIMQIYPFSSTSDINYSGKRYNLLPDDEIDECHQVVGSFPNKTYLLDNGVMIEVFDKYYTYTTRTNNSGDYLICGIPTGNQKLHMDLDLSDCGILSQRPRDFVYKGYTIEQFENPNQFKISDELNSLSQIISQDQTINVIPFWGDANDVETIGITRADIKISFKFEPTCIFMGCIAGDNQSNGISKKCVPTEQMGAMDELVTGEGTIEMIRKTMGGDVEEFQIRGTQLIDGNGVWCYQIPMNLDYIMTDEYGNMVATDDPSKGIPTRAQVRFRVSMTETEQSMDNYFRCKVLVPHNPQNKDEIDYNFGTNTKDISFRDLFWNNVYTVKSYIPRFQKSQRWRNERFSGIKHCNIYGQNNPIPYNSLRIRLPFMFIILCALIKGLIKIVTFVNRTQSGIVRIIDKLLLGVGPKAITQVKRRHLTCTMLGDGMCPDLDGWYFAPGCGRGIGSENAKQLLLEYTLDYALERDGIKANDENGDIESYPKEEFIDEKSIDTSNAVNTDEIACLTTDIDYFVSCIEMNLAQEYKVIQFDFYNDWINGFIYMPRWMKQITKKRSYLFGLIKIKSKHRACYNDPTRFGAVRRYTQQCTLEYGRDNDGAFNIIKTKFGCDSKKQKCHKKKGMSYFSIFGKNGGIINETITSKGQYVYYFKPCEWGGDNNQKVNLFANDLVLLGSLNNCNERGIPQAFKYLSNSSYKMPTNLALTNMDDMGYLYANQNDTVCSNTSKIINKLDAESGVTELYSSFTITKNYGTTEETKINYLPMEDVIPTTEAAGISWNYTGPGQGRNDKTNGYFPGGHFLGLSCTNSETNIKTCVNLQRICELGVNISQRREYIRKINSDDNNIEYDVAYHIPSGFISKDEIIDNDFRRMFATMNNKRLIANGINNKTGYPTYNFTYYNPINFNGSFNNYVNKTSDINGGLYSYNMKTNGIENGVIDDLNSLGITKPEDYDANEIWYTSTRTVEESSLDYYLFRLGLSHDDYKSKQNEKFLNKGTTVSLPQYENSFYFYFGLKEGSTALDEFMRQFFSNCEDHRRKVEEPEIVTTVSTDLCSMKGDISISIFNMTSPYDYTISDGKNIVEKGYGLTIDTILSEKLNFGTYNVTVTDSNDIVLSDTINLGINLISFNIDYEPFIFKASNFNPEDVMMSGTTYDSGYIIIDRFINVDGKKFNILPDNENDRNILLYIKDSEHHILGPSNTSVGSDWKNNKPNNLNNSEVNFTYDIIIGENPNHTDDKIKIYVWKPNTIYDIYVGYKCDQNDVPNYSLIQQIKVRGKYEVDIYMGNSKLSYNAIFEPLNGVWWEGKDNIINRDNNNEGEPIGWMIRHYTFRQTLNDNETFDSNVFGVSLENNGITEVLFGQPERQDSSEKLKEMMVDIFPELYNGYSLDDRSSIIPTYGPNNITYNRKCFGKTVIDNDGTVLGYPITDIKLTDITYSNITNQYTITYSGKNDKLLIGNGCVIQFNDGSLLYPIIDNETSMHAVSLDDDIRYDSTMITSAFIYPLFIYPVIYRPFYNEVNFMESGLKKMIMTVNSESVKTPSYIYDSNNFSAAGKIHNGITYNSLFGESLINDVPIILSGETYDMYTDDKWSDRISSYGWYGTENSPLFNMDYTDNVYSFTITEGAPTVLATSFPLMQIEGEITKPKFYDFMTFDYNSTNSTYTFMGYPLGGSDNDIKYYAVNLNGHQPFETSKDILYVKDDVTNTYYLACEYNIAAKYNNIGDDIFVGVIFSETSNGYIYEVNYSIKNEDGKVLNNSFTGTSKSDDIYECYDVIKENLSNVGIDILHISGINSSDYDANSYYELIKEGTQITINKGDRYNSTIFNHINSTIIGVKEQVMGDGKNVLRVLRLYPDMINAANYSDGSLKPYLRIVIDGIQYTAPTSNVNIMVPSAGGGIQFRISSSYDWEVTGVDDIAEWVSLPNIFGGSGDQYFSFTTEINNTDNERKTSFGLKSRNLTINNIVITQGIASLELKSSANISILYTGGTFTISFISTADWRMTYPTWCTNNSNEAEGIGSNNLVYKTFTIGENPSNENDRVGDIIIMHKYNVNTFITITINQGKSSYLFIDPLSMVLEKNDTTKILTVTSERPWRIETSSSYLTFSPNSGTGDISNGEQVIVGRNYYGDYDIDVNAYIKDEQKTIKFTVTLNAIGKYIALIEDSSNEYNIPQNGGTIEFIFDASDNWEAVVSNSGDGKEWCKLDSDMSSNGPAGRSSLRYTILENNEYETRTAYITVYLVGDESENFVVKVTQGDFQWIINLEPKYMDLIKGIPKQLTIISNVAWSAYTNQDWCVVNPVTGGTNGANTTINIDVTSTYESIGVENGKATVYVKPINYGDDTSISSCDITAAPQIPFVEWNRIGYYHNNSFSEDDIIDINNYYSFDDAEQHWLYLKFTANLSWVISVSDTNMFAFQYTNESRGTAGTYEIKMRVLNNYMGDNASSPRTGIIKLYLTDYENTYYVTLTITQSGRGPVEIIPVFEFTTPSNKYLDYKGGLFDIGIRYNDAFREMSKPEWVQSPTPVYGRPDSETVNTFTYTVLTNNELSTRTGFIEFRMDDHPQALTFTIEQGCNAIAVNLNFSNSHVYFNGLLTNETIVNGEWVKDNFDDTLYTKILKIKFSSDDIDFNSNANCNAIVNLHLSATTSYYDDNNYTLNGEWEISDIQPTQVIIPKDGNGKILIRFAETYLGFSDILPTHVFADLSNITDTITETNMDINNIDIEVTN